MTYTVLLYGATGYSGRLIAAEAQRSWRDSAQQSDYRMVLAGRDGPRLKVLANALGMDFRVFGLDDPGDIVRGLDGVSTLVNAAGPFARTAQKLAAAALEANCHYVDINDEVDVYQRIDDMGFKARKLGLAMVGSAGHRAAASDVLLNAALQILTSNSVVSDSHGLGVVRIAMSHSINCSRGSAETVWRSMREQVAVVRVGETEDADGVPTRQSVLWHEPVGKLQRTFDFGSRDPNAQRDVRVAIAANHVDTLAAHLTIARHRLPVRSIESYVEAGVVARMGYQLGALLTPLAAGPGARLFRLISSSLLPEGPTARELDEERQIIVLEIHDAFGTPVIDWRLQTPNSYQLTAQLAIAVAAAVSRGVLHDGARLSGWLTPAQVLVGLDPRVNHESGPLRGCGLEARITAT